ncbi:dephospho-CoA kinase [Candidatus Woesearchaeota archaeon]|nr:dephospho-CoA kinase [Candidatus Woesearchaeota archaeon]
MIIGITGTMAAGKTTVAKILEEHGFRHLTYSDILRQAARKRGIEPTRQHLQQLGTALKEEHGPGVLSKLLLAHHQGDLVADGIRTVPEIEELKRHGAVIWAVVASQETRFARLKSRNRKGDPATLDAFKDLDELENSGATSGQDINACIKRADRVIDNDGSLEDLHFRVETLL